MSSIADQVITAPVNEFCVLSGLGRTRVYELLNKGEIESVTIGRRRLIIIDSYRKLLETRRGTPAEQPTTNVPTISRRVTAAHALAAEQLRRR
jgi:excisionase family DNA binding protein